jgi:hypothetical protein
VWTASNSAALNTLPVQTLAGRDERIHPAIQQVRTTLVQAFPTLIAPTTDNENHAMSTHAAAMSCDQRQVKAS